MPVVALHGTMLSPWLSGSQQTSVGVHWCEGLQLDVSATRSLPKRE